MIKCRPQTNGRVAQWQSSGLLSHWLQVRVLPRSQNRPKVGQNPHEKADFLPSRPARGQVFAINPPLGPTFRICFLAELEFISNVLVLIFRPAGQQQSTPVNQEQERSVYHEKKNQEGSDDDNV
jgi:hypothetical protein